ncbi:WD40/YVTN/BNR-like repeat-containing protein [Azohydromonas caseinilytica]|uniref:Glycosyl hydrolase n=1 Tax=Azohydromonas caseinilytica TaxID=2728836 RepID=A0A848F979_9BURK|nr:YCF48-related protein [Azohydromonas caseinilytica]NML16697.1 glycosyl hydrolase [Azohydromonas caseinilytica]
MRTALGVAMAAVMAMAASHAFSPRPTPPLAATTLPVQRMHFNTLVHSSAGMVAGGELGTLLYSVDEGRSWLPARVSARRQALITQVRFDKDGRHGLAVGHEGWILRSDDGGLSWSELHFDEAQGEPLMSIAQLPSGRILAVGAFGRMLRSDDQGRSWQRVELPGVEDKHLNGIVGNEDGTRWLVVGERGLVLQGDAQGEQWQMLDPFYNGSFYNAVSLPGQEWLVYGMRGHVFRSDSGARQWRRAELPAPASFFGHARSADGRLVLVGQGGLLAVSSDEGQRFALQRIGSSATLTDVVAQGTRLWLAGEAGLHPHDKLGITAERAVNGDLR